MGDHQEPMDALGRDLLEVFWPAVLKRSRCAVARQVLDQCILPTLALVMSVFVHAARPKMLLSNDQVEGVWPFSADFMQSLDTVAILPQFFKFRRCSADAGGKCAYVSPILAQWLAFVAAARFLAFLSGVFNVAGDYFDKIHPRWNNEELFYCVCSGVNLAVVSEYIFHYLMACCHRQRVLALPT